MIILPPLKDADHPKRTARRARKRATTVPRRRSSRPSSTILSATAGSRSTLSSTATRARMYFDSSRSCVTDDRELGQAAVPTYFISRDQTFEAMRGDAVTCSACRKACERRLRAHTPPLPEGPFDLLLIDLPLAWRGRSPKGEGRSPQRHYGTSESMSASGLLRPRQVLSEPCRKACTAADPASIPS